MGSGGEKQGGIEGGPGTGVLWPMVMSCFPGYRTPFPPSEKRRNLIGGAPTCRSQPDACFGHHDSDRCDSAVREANYSGRLQPIL